MKKIAVITGASSGMGARFVNTVDKLGMPIDEVWVIARRAERLASIECPYPVKTVPLDLTDRASFNTYREMLDQEQPVIELLVNASGYGKFDAVENVPLETSLNMVDLNCQAVQAMCQISIPYMGAGAHILNIASVAAFQPVPYINTYAASKAFVLSYSRSLNRELKKYDIRVTALCPFWTKTEFFDRAVRTDKDAVVKKYAAMYDPKDIVDRAWRDMKRGRDVSQYGFIARGQAILCKILPHSLVMSIWLKQQQLS